MQKESTKSEFRNSSYDQKKFKFKYVWNQILNFQKHVQAEYLDRGGHNKEFGVGFIGFGQTSKKLWSFEEHGLIYEENITDGSLAENKQKKKNLSDERPLQNLI